MKKLVLVGVFIVALVGVYQHKDLFRLFSDLSMPIRHDMFRETQIMLPMRDGVALNTRVYRPFSFSGEQYPTILKRTTYGAFDFNVTKFFVEHGYVVVEQFVRGRYGSEGEYSPHRYSASDGYDTLDWIVEQSWSNGKIGTFGCSYLGEVQIALASEKHPNHLAAIADAGAGLVGKLNNNYGYFGFYENGVLNLASSLGWFAHNGAAENSNKPQSLLYGVTLSGVVDRLPVVDLDNHLVGRDTLFSDFVSLDLNDPRWEQEGYISNEDTFATPILHLNGWFDQGIQGTFDLIDGMKTGATNLAAKHQHMVIGPGNHCESRTLETGRLEVGEMEFDYEALGYKQLYLKWFDYWLKNVDGSLPAKYVYYQIHGDGWKHQETWGEGRNYKNYFLTSDMQLTSEAAVDSRDFRYIYDPNNPLPSVGGTICCTNNPDDVSGPVPQNELFSREDVLLFESMDLSEDLDVLGAPFVDLYVSSSAKDTDFTVKLLDIYPDGRAFSINDSVLRMRYRDGFERTKLVEPGKRYAITVSLRPISYRLRKGHRIGVLISSSNFPRLARNLNTGEDVHASSRVEVATNTIHVDDEFLSKLRLPIDSVSSHDP